MSMTIGRAAIADDPWAGTLRARGNRVSFRSELGAASVDEAKARMQQLLGLVGNADEEVVPFTWSEDATFDGFYRVTDVQFDWTAATLNTGWCPFSIDMERVAGGFAKPRFETVATTVVRTNSHSITAPAGIMYAFYTPTAYDTDRSTIPAGVGGGGATLTTDEGSVTVGYWSVASTYTWRRFVKPADFYKGGVRLEVKYGSTWYPVHGLHIPSATAGDWRISNGYCRVYPTSASGNGRFTIETYRSGSWVGREFAVAWYDDTGAGWGYGTTFTATGDSNGFITPSVLINSPKLVVVRCAVGPYTTTFSLRAADTWVEVTSNDASSSADSLHLGLKCSSTVASTTFTGGLRATSNDANGLRYLISSTEAVTADTTNGRLYLDTDTVSSTTWQITADYQVGVTTSATGVRDLFMQARSERERVVAR